MMMPLMQKMAAPLPLASVICHLATMAVMMNMHIELSTLRHTPVGGPHRTLLDSDGDAVVTVAHMTKAVDHLQHTLGSRLTAVERDNSELKERMKTLAYSQTDTDHDSYADLDDGACALTSCPAAIALAIASTSPRWHASKKLVSIYIYITEQVFTPPGFFFQFTGRKA